MSKKSLSREAAEKEEGLEMVKNEVPENRVQQDQQINPTSAANDTKPVQGSFQTKRSTAKGATLKQEVISDAITGSNSSAGMGINAAGRSVSGTAGGILGANNSTPFADKSRSGSRVGKKLDRTATKLNYTPCEQVLLNVDESKPLADAADEDQGYNGTYRNEFARSQKIMGAVPADLLFQRSVDFIFKDKLYFVEGQQVFQNDADRTSVNPSLTINQQGKEVSTHYTSGNYLHRNLHFGLDSNGKVKYFYADVVDLTHASVSADDANVASAHRLIKNNVAELDRISMDSKAGDEKADLWTPLARAIAEPTKASYLMSSIEADTGAYVYLAYSKLVTNMSFQLNRAAKDGLDVIGPAIEQCVGWRQAEEASSELASLFGNTLHPRDGDTDHVHAFSSACYAAGDPTLMIAVYDSNSKYNNKADLLLQPRGWRMHAQTADNNINPLKVPAEFANVFAATETFSTIDHEYDPLMPICVTDKANLITVHNFNELASFYKDAGFKHVNLKFSATNIESTYEYKEILLAAKGAPKIMGWPKIFVYEKHTANTDGLKYTSGTGVIELDPDSSNIDREIDIIVSPVAITTAGYTKLVEENVTYAKDLVLHVPVEQDDDSKISDIIEEYSDGPTWRYYQCGEPFAYAYSDLRNKYIVDVQHPLIHGIIAWLEDSVGGKIRTLINQEDFKIPLVFSTQYMTLAQLAICAATPWISRVRMNSMKDVIYYEDNVGSYPYSKLDSIKNVPFKNFVNFGFTTYDEPLETKVMNPVQAVNWIMPEFFWKIATEKYVLPWYFCEEDLNVDGSVNDDASTMCMPSIRSGIRLGALDTLYSMTEKDIRLGLDRMTKTFLRDTDIANKYAYKYGRTTDGQIMCALSNSKLFTLQKVLSCPRELGLSMDAPLGVLTADPADNSEHAWISSDILKAMSADGTCSSYRIKVFTNAQTSLHSNILDASNVNITRAANYTQKWYEAFANNSTSNLDVTGLVFGMGDDVELYSPFAELGTGASAGLSTGASVVSYQRSVNTRLQFLPFVISPFDNNFASDDSYSHDIYDIAYYFGLCGFRASDYRESVYNREKEVVNQGITFVSDPWIEASPIIKGASGKTGVKLSKGYVLK